jgi:hypothetical protein
MRAILRLLLFVGVVGGLRLAAAPDKLPPFNAERRVSSALLTAERIDDRFAPARLVVEGPAYGSGYCDRRADTGLTNDARRAAMALAPRAMADTAASAMSRIVASVARTSYSQLEASRPVP